jgi:phage-related protein
MSPFPFVFWKQPASGKQPALEWLQRLDKEDRRKMGVAMRTVELGWPLGMPLCRSMGGGLHELRVSLKGKQEARLLFCSVTKRLLGSTLSSRRRERRRTVNWIWRNSG